MRNITDLQCRESLTIDIDNVELELEILANVKNRVNSGMKGLSIVADRLTNIIRSNSFANHPLYLSLL